MISRVLGSTISGLMPCLVRVEVSVQGGLPKFEMVGLGQSAVREGKDRILTAIQSSNFSMGSQRIIVNLAPASIRKDGSSLDLPIALALLTEAGFLLPENLPPSLAVIGELSLDGSVQPVRGVFAMVQELKENGIENFIVPERNSVECAKVASILPAIHLQQVVECLEKKREWPPLPAKPSTKRSKNEVDWSDVRGQPVAKRAMEIAAAGGHHVMLSGTPGVGKTLLAKRFITILPELTSTQDCMVRKIHSLENGRSGFDSSPPFRMPHHHASLSGMIGGSRSCRMGEFSLAHLGVLFMDEFPEFRRDVVEALREPLEDGVVRISRADGAFLSPAKFQLVAAMNLCPCGALGDEKKVCSCTPFALQKYRNKVSRPIQDRLDLLIELKNTDWKVLWEKSKGDTSTQVRERVVEARKKQSQRYRQESVTNAGVDSKILLHLVKLDSRTRNMLDAFVKKERISLRSVERITRVSRTIADLNHSSEVKYKHVCEALQYRFFLPNYI